MPAPSCNRCYRATSTVVVTIVTIVTIVIIIIASYYQARLRTSENHHPWH
jgi:hypothetical protein